jgi:hypothetical protein
MTVNNLKGLSTHSIKPMILPSVLSSFLDSDFGATGAAIETLIVCSGFGLGDRLLTGATLAGGFLVTIMRIYPVYDSEISPCGVVLELSSYSKSQTLSLAVLSAFVWLTHLPYFFHAVSLASLEQGHACLDTQRVGQLETT